MARMLVMALALSLPGVSALAASVVGVLSADCPQHHVHDRGTQHAAPDGCKHDHGQHHGPDGMPCPCGPGFGCHGLVAPALLTLRAALVPPPLAQAYPPRRDLAPPYPATAPRWRPPAFG